MVNAQEWLNANYPLEERKNVTKLDIRKKDLEGHLDLKGFINLRELECYNNKLTSIDLKGLNQLEGVNCPNNHLTNFDYSVLNPEKLISLNITANKLTEQNISAFSNFTNLEYLWIGNDDEEVKQGFCNRFIGSLESLRGLTNLKSLYISNTDVNSGWEYLPKSVEEIYCSNRARTISEVKNLEGQLEISPFFDFKDGKYIKNWKDIHLDFTPELQKEWEDWSFSYKECKEWIDAGLKVSDAGYVRWLITLSIIKDKDNAWVLSHVNSNELREDYSNSYLSRGVIEKIKDFDRLNLTLKQRETIEELVKNEELKKQYYCYGLCKKCKQPKTGNDWCQSCESSYFQYNFNNWTSGNKEIDRFIQKYQLQATNSQKVLEWIPYDRFTDIKYVANGGFGKVYKAIWKWKYKEVALKVLKNSQELSSDFLKEITSYKLFERNNESYSGIVNCYGISQDPETKDYIMVMEYIKYGNLSQYLSRHYEKLDFRYRILQLWAIACGLKCIHEKGLIHQDFHPGNILINSDFTSSMCEDSHFPKKPVGGATHYKQNSYIADLGLCRPVRENDERKKYGVLPYVAPEVLRGENYTQKSDIYSFGIIAYEVLTGLPPYYDIVHDGHLATKICQGLRPCLNLGNIKPLIPLRNLISKCWDAEPENRPAAWELSIDLYNLCYNLNTLISLTNLELKFETPSQTHSQSFRTSRLLEFKNLPQPQNNLSKEWQTSALLKLQIKAIEEEINFLKKSLENEVVESLESFVKSSKKIARNRDDNESRNEIRKLRKKLKENFSDESIEKVIKYCKRMVELEQNLEREELEARVQILS